ncbi:hypothetical protein NXG27_13295 [Megasphaera paucivorans]|uniref:Uncharacterized protein n=1 Tax=Megasphaera paucivorans TaxID=349095 RepID=A0A1G9U974_9FIRM|nr:hypothetical protein [Megasphaera paucivorans]SDM56546.1 hypothetical protein SAMN05660299_01119 [Megasphaera paucivorans]
MESRKSEYLQEFYIGQKTAEILAIDYDENQLLVAELSSKKCHQRKETMPDVK